ncbi:MAG: hypothetical protein HQL38_16525, partial [Alphaproteobacteria bacterium]|nr:hypothetical protein [Alphaproteobacteria bacterium]
SALAGRQVAPAVVAAEPIDFDALDRMLAEDDAGALDLLSRMAAPAGQAAAFARLRRQIEDFDFEDARATLATLLARGTS